MRVRTAKTDITQLWTRIGRLAKRAHQGDAGAGNNPGCKLRKNQHTTTPDRLTRLISQVKYKTQTKDLIPSVCVSFPTFSAYLRENS
jgi:hypothetical protein